MIGSLVTPLDKFKYSGNHALPSVAFSLSVNPSRHDLDYFFTSIDAILLPKLTEQ